MFSLSGIKIAIRPPNLQPPTPVYSQVQKTSIQSIESKSQGQAKRLQQVCVYTKSKHFKGKPRFFDSTSLQHGSKTSDKPAFFVTKMEEE